MMPGAGAVGVGLVVLMIGAGLFLAVCAGLILRALKVTGPVRWAYGGHVVLMWLAAGFWPVPAVMLALSILSVGCAIFTARKDRRRAMLGLMATSVVLGFAGFGWWAG